MLPIAVRRSLADAVISQIAHDLRQAADRGGLVKSGGHVSNTHLVLDQEGWTELGDTLAEAMGRFIDIQAEAANRIAAGADAEEDGDTFLANVSLMLFEK